jgi:TPP-dependent pyruvate/acetoin dehydrogenase alpha subunit
MARKILTKKTIEKIDAEVATELDAAEKFADEGPPPEPSTFDDLLYAN